MVRYFTVIVMVAVFAGATVFWFVTTPTAVSASALPAYTPNLANGEVTFNIGGCASCHANLDKTPENVDRQRLGGGRRLLTPFGTLVAPNISPDPSDGIGNWTEADFVTAMWDGTSAAGDHLYPAFPYTSYRHMELNDLRDLFAFLKTLPPVSGKAGDHDLAFPFNIRRFLGIWKLMFLKGGPFMPDETRSAQWNRGAYLVDGPGHCAECHSPRNVLGGIIDSERFAGGPAPDGKGWVPNITPVGLQNGDVTWSEKDIASFLADGMNPAGDFAGGAMAEVIRNTSLLSRDDRAAIAAYVASLAPTQGPMPPKKK